ncbi:MAG: hypothetical protein LBC41_07540, partial [Clostridiales bacterium]|jgi:hypothetical protein|nr:hypothetical protein [Clostridiales bacterium]
LKVFLAGWSQCGGFLTRYREDFAEAASAKLGFPVYDGYYHAGAGSAPSPINSFEAPLDFWSNRENFTGIIKSSEPYIVINTETETPHTRWLGDSDEPGALFRAYEFPGSSHDSKYNLLDYYEGGGSEDLKKINRPNGYYGAEAYPIDYPYEFLFNAAFRKLYVWSREGMPPPASLFIEKYPDGQSKKDALGNTIGGVRTPFLDYPTCLYSKYCTIKERPEIKHDFWGHVEPFSPELLKSLYGSLDNYLSLVLQRTNEIISLGYLLPSDRDDILETAKKFAIERGMR